MSEPIKFFDNMIAECVANLHTVMPCRVLSFNEATNTADVQPLFMRKIRNRPAEPMTPISNIPVLKRKRKIVDDYIVETQQFEKGDIVLVAFAERAMDKVSTKQVHDPVFARKHALEDGIILGLLY